MIDYQMARAEALHAVERSLTRCTDIVNISVRQGSGPGHILYDRAQERKAEKEQELALIQSLSEQEWQERQRRALARQECYVREMDSRIAAMWNAQESGKPLSKEQVIF